MQREMMSYFRSYNFEKNGSAMGNRNNAMNDITGKSEPARLLSTSKRAGNLISSGNHITLTNIDSYDSPGDGFVLSGVDISLKNVRTFDNIGNGINYNENSKVNFDNQSIPTEIILEKIQSSHNGENGININTDQKVILKDVKTDYNKKNGVKINEPITVQK
jgi:hypothetical protein